MLYSIVYSMVRYEVDADELYTGTTIASLQTLEGHYPPSIVSRVLYRPYRQIRGSGLRSA